MSPTRAPAAPAAPAAAAEPPASATRIQLALVEDDPDFRDAIASALAAAPDMQLIGTATSRAEGLALLYGPPADVLLVDLGLPDGSGIDVITAATQFWPRCDTMVATTFGDEEHVLQSIEAGVKGYLLKDSSPARIVEEIRNLRAGGSPISPLIARRVLMRFRQGTARPLVADDDTPGQTTLSARELQTLEYVTKGFTFEEAARLMGVSRHTVQNFVRRIYAKLEVRSKVEAIYEARKRGLLPD